MPAKLQFTPRELHYLLSLCTADRLIRARELYLAVKVAEATCENFPIAFNADIGSLIEKIEDQLPDEFCVICGKAHDDETEHAE